MLALFLACVAAPRGASAQADLITGLGGPLDFGTGVLARDDDTSSPTAIDLSPTFPGGVDFYGSHYTSVFLNMNGSITFGRSLGSFTPDSFPLPASSAPMIAAWWADVDTRGVPADPDTNLVYYGGDATHFVFTWIDVGYFDSHLDKLNAFQIVLSPDPGGAAGAFLAELRYHRCEWTTGDLTSGGHAGLGGIAAQAGFDAADGTHFVMLPGSRTADVLALCTTSNVGMPGVWSLNSEVAAPVCGNALRETGEACDDGNVEPHDGCDELCQRDTPCYTLLDDGGALVPFDGSSFETGLPDGGAPFEACPFDAGPPDAGPMDAGPMDAGPPDAGVDGGRRGDAGTRFDAGPRPDGGRRDAGMVSHPTIDVVGGGCGCRAAGRGSRSTLALGIALGLGIALRARQRWRGCVQISGGR